MYTYGNEKGYNRLMKYNGVMDMKLTEYLHDQLKFLNDQMEDAKSKNNETMQYLVDSKITEVKLILEALQKGIIDGIS